MTRRRAASADPVVLSSPAGLRFEINRNGSLRRIAHGDVVLNLFPGSEMEDGPCNIYLRRHGAAIESVPLLGPRSPATIHLSEAEFVVRGEWNGLRFALALVLARKAPAWFWHLAVLNAGSSATGIDAICAQDIALAHYAAVRTNEYYVSQYVDHTPLAHARRGAVLAVRQNLPMGGRHPWAVLGSLGRGVGFATDALQFYGLAARAGHPPAALAAPVLPGKRLQHEHSMAVVQDALVRLEPGARVESGFFGWFEEDHPAASSEADLVFVEKAFALPEAKAPRSELDGAGVQPPATLFTACPTLQALDLVEAEITALFGGERREVEYGIDAGQSPFASSFLRSDREGPARATETDTPLSFFTGAARHVVLKAKELRVLRPHGHILRTGSQLVPDEASLTSTVWMGGVFHSMLTQGHVNINRFLSATRSYLGLLRAPGVRVFVDAGDGYRLLEMPSAFEMAPDACRWIYRHSGGLIEVRSWAAIDRHEMGLAVDVREGVPCRFLISHHVALDGEDGAAGGSIRFARRGSSIAVRPRPDSDLGRRFPRGSFRISAAAGTVFEQVGGDELLFRDGRSRGQPFLVVVTAPSRSVDLRITGHLIAGDRARRTARTASPAAASERFWNELTGPVALAAPSSSPLAADVARLQEILPWFAADAMVHYLAPRGLEQYSGGGWGTRDVCQGPVELLLALGRFEPARDLLLRVFRAQNPDGDWPQWFMFHERERNIRPPDSHGDIVFWPLYALAGYLLAADDASLLDEVVPFFDSRGDEHAERATLWAHVERALAVTERRVIPGTSLAAYGNGDWNDSLQPADPAMRERLCSAWTVTLHHQTLSTLAQALRHVGRGGPAPRLERAAARVRDDFQRLLVAEGTLAGFAYFHDGGRIDHLLHPRDAATGIHYRLLPMIYAILADLFTSEQAAAHVRCIREHLLGVDGARLFDRPPRYRGGPQRHFQRAESSTFFGREIGLMYVHAHLRYAEAMAHYGDAEAFFLALRQANPIGIRSAVPAAAPRQANCYHSSSDAALADRYEAARRYAEVRAGKVPLEGGWRVYSSGAGIAVRLIHHCLLGLQRRRSALLVDPVLPSALDGLRARLPIAGRTVDVTYRVGRRGCGPTAVTLDGTRLSFERLCNPYRPGGVVVPMAAVRDAFGAGASEMTIELG